MLNAQQCETLVEAIARYLNARAAQMESATHPDHRPAAPAAETPTRKRRTKAEIEADEAAAASTTVEEPVKEEPKAEAPKEDTKKPDAPAKVEYPVVQAAILDLGKAKGRDAAMAMLSEFGVTRGTELDPAVYQKVLDRCAELMAESDLA